MEKWKKICYGCLPFLAAFMLMYMLPFLFLLAGGFLWGLFHYEQVMADSNAVSRLFVEEAWLKEMQILTSCFVYLVFCFVFGIWYKRAFAVSGQKQAQGRKGMRFPVFFPIRMRNFSLVPGAVVFGISLQCFCSNALNLILPLFPKIQSSYMELMDNMGTGQGIVPLIYMGLLAPIAEELIFRGLILRYEQKELPFWCANVIQAFLFGLYHQNIVQFVYAFCIGLLLGYLCWKLQSLKLVMLIHGVINISGNLLSFFNLDVLPVQKRDMFIGIFISMVFAAASCLFLLRQKKTTVTDLQESIE